MYFLQKFKNYKYIDTFRRVPFILVFNYAYLTSYIPTTDVGSHIRVTANLQQGLEI